jgi:hypothetical protein
VSVTTEAGSTKMRDRSTFTPGATDETAEYLDANGWTLLDGANGERYIRCPFEDGHSTGGDPTSTVYFPAVPRALSRPFQVPARQLRPSRRR